MSTTQRDLFEPPVTESLFGVQYVSKGKVVFGSSLHRWALTIIILCAVVWRVSSDALAQEATPSPLKMARSTLWSFGPVSNTAPHLVISMAENSQRQGRHRTTQTP